ncbi:MAG: thioredoxin [Stomatobaculum sp.]|nr:thioredoxin [Stomatobaculum sp.]
MKKKKTVSARVTYLLILLAAASCAFGVVRGEVKTVKRKAVNICMECIGIG